VRKLRVGPHTKYNATIYVVVVVVVFHVYIPSSLVAATSASEAAPLQLRQTVSPEMAVGVQGHIDVRTNNYWREVAKKKSNEIGGGRKERRRTNGNVPGERSIMSADLPLCTKNV